jgi:hypothetical protein
MKIKGKHPKERLRSKWGKKKLQMEENAWDKIRRSLGKRNIDGEAWLLDILHKAEMSEKEKEDDDVDDADEDDDDDYVDASLTWLVV